MISIFASGANFGAALILFSAGHFVVASVNVMAMIFCGWVGMRTYNA